MFRDRQAADDRGDPQELRPLVQEVLRDGFAANVGVSDASGPWVAPLVYVIDDALDLYWISVADCRHSRAIAADPRIAVTVIASHETDNERALQMSGTAVRIDGPLFELERQLAAKRGLPAPESPGEILAGGFAWYRFTADRVELTYNTRFGYDRRTYRPQP